MRIVQLMPTIVPGDAVSNDALALCRLLRRWDANSRIYAERSLPGLPEGMVKDARQLPSLGEEDVLIYHMSIGSPVSLRIDELRCRKVMVYHNITPPRYFAPYSAEYTRACREGYAELERMREWFDYAIADSDFNRQGLRQAGYTCPIDVCPVLVPLEDYAAPADERTLKKYGDGRTNILFVGRVAPNKKQEDVIRAFACYQRRYDPTARLILAGSDGIGAYKKRLWDYTRALGVKNVKFTGHISFSQLLALYRTAHVLLCMSEHEGFCVPLLESMVFSLPVVARNAAAVGETLGDAGILLEDGDPEKAAAALHRAVRDEALRRELREKEKRRLGELSGEAAEGRFCGLFAAFLAAPRPERKRRVVQMLPRLSRGDAVSGDALALRQVLRTFPVREDVWCYECPDPLLRAAVRCSETPPELRKEDVAVFHFAMGEKMAECFAALRCKKVLIYHSVTQPEFPAPYSAPMAAACRKGRAMAAGLAAKADRVFAVSEYDRRELLAMGVGQVEVLPLLLPLEEYDAPPRESTLRRYGDGRTNILFVGRVAPNKKFEDAVRAFACYRERFDPTARLILAGADDALPAYTNRLRAYIARLGGEGIELTGKVAFEELLALYRTAHVFLCMSEHEGFCVPLAEAMYFDVPIVARAAAAVPDTLGGSGVLLPDGDAERAAEAIDRLRRDGAYREEVLRGQRLRLRDFAWDRIFGQDRALFAEVLEGER